jgi:hypothetical protein
MLGLKAETEELRLEYASRRVPPNLVPKLPSAQSRSSSVLEAGVFGMSLRVDRRSFPSPGSSKSVHALLWRRGGNHGDWLRGLASLGHLDGCATVSKEVVILVHVAEAVEVDETSWD